MAARDVLAGMASVAARRGHCSAASNRHSGTRTLVMRAKNPVGDKATAVVADDWKETLKRVGGSQSDDWNHVLGNQAIQSLWIKQSDNEVRARQYNAAIAGLIGIAPQDEIEGMIAAQLIAHCFRDSCVGNKDVEAITDNAAVLPRKLAGGSSNRGRPVFCCEGSGLNVASGGGIGGRSVKCNLSQTCNLGAGS